VASDSTIPFSAELEHTRAYLAVEQAQFEDMLLVEYDTPVTNFRLPPLTLQPLVENSVKHGMNPYSGPLHVSVRTRRTEAGIEVIVEDNGPGFDPDDESKPHTTLANIRQRMEMMCGGSLTIRPRDGGGTVATVTIPDRQEQADPRQTS
jgi:LytS/YehU family sensor histidine kinase